MASKYAFNVADYEDFYRHPERYYVKPFRIFSNLYFVGNKDVGSYLLDTEEGYILIDTTYPTTRAQMIESLWEAGCDPRKIRYILHTHGHFDHCGTTAFLVSLSGAKTFLGRGDAELLKERPELMLSEACPYSYLEVFAPDVIIEDGDVITLGSTQVRCVATPGHTPGVLTFLIPLEENGETHLAGLYGGAGVNTLCREEITRFGTESWRDDFIPSLHKVRDEKVDIVLGNHTAQSRTLEKLAKRGMDPDGPNPFIDPEEWVRFLDETEARYNQMLQDEADGSDQIG